jgi:opacity protein-like surface antigen
MERARIWLAASLALLVMALAVGSAGRSSAAVQPTYKQTRLEACLVKRHVSFIHFPGPYRAIKLLGLKEDDLFTGSTVFTPTALNGTVVVGEGQFEFMKSPSAAKADLPNITRRFRLGGLVYLWQIKANVIALFPHGRQSPFANPIVAPCMRASLVA